jgi:hypothetical protein
VDLTHEFPAISFRFRVKHAELKNLALQFSTDADFKNISFQSAITDAQALKAPDAQAAATTDPKVAAPASVKSLEYQVKLSGVYLVVSEPVVDLAYGNDHQLFWRVVAKSTDPLIFSEPQPVKFKVNPTVKVVSRTGESAHSARLPAELQSPAIIWEVENRIPTRYRVSFYRDSAYENKICSETIRAGAVPKVLSGSAARFDGAELATREEFIPKVGTFCHSSRNSTLNLKSAFYRVEPLTPTGTPLPLEKGSAVRGSYSFKQK